MKKKEIVGRQKAEAAIAKSQRDRRDISLFNENIDNYYSDTDDTDLNQEDSLNLIQDDNNGRRTKTILIEPYNAI